MTQIELAYLGLGANLGDPVEQMLEAKRRLVLAPQVFDLRCSSLYISSPVGYSKQDEFVNCVVEIKTALSAEALLSLTQSIEQALGRQRDKQNQNAARSIDIDLLLFSEQRIHTANLQVPHPRLAERLFVLLPLQELVPDIQIGEIGSVSDVLQQGKVKGRFDGQSVFCLSR